ncbi:hypothetical protein AQJ27_36485 [Streptomyces olivochromogenes]|nr:hypothetical protein AQJ27_36485 [Streptomyces olivochromogenes]
MTGRRRGSADRPFITAAVLRTMAYIAPDHPVLRSMSAVYWRGGDKQVEGVLYRSQYFDKLVARYVGSGFRFCALLYERLGVRREFASEIGPKTPSEVREAVDVLRFLEPEYRVWAITAGADWSSAHPNRSTSTPRTRRSTSCPSTRCSTLPPLPPWPPRPWVCTPGTARSRCAIGWPARVSSEW